MDSPLDGLQLTVQDGGLDTVELPAGAGQLVATVHVVFSKQLLRESREDTLNQVADDVHRRVRSLLNNIPEDDPDEPPSD
jgi:hypothetical protein